MPSIYLIAFILVVAVFEVLREVPGINLKIVNYSYWIMNTLVIFGWCIAHAKKFENKPHLLMAALCGLIPPIGVPVYFYTNFGFKNGSIKLILAILFFCLIVIISVFFEKIGQTFMS